MTTEPNVVNNRMSAAPHAGLLPRRLRAGQWSFRPVYSSYIDLLGVSHGRMPCLHA
ncbi:MAG TPA: hypothetical protein VMM78_02805 [Thermomicrobiales bacterium]|nr:hypothetical protein [Thermomicrobiales bacterium]